MENKTIALASPATSISVSLLEEFLNEKSISLDWYDDAISALEHFTSKQYPLIVTAFEIAPGLGYDSEMRECWEQSDDKERYAEIALHLVRKTRLSPLNKITPIIVADFFDAVRDKIHPNAEARALGAGATLYFPLFGRDSGGYKGLVSEIIKRVG